MKKRIIPVVASIVLCAAAITGYKVYEHQTVSPNDLLMMKNLEALTNDEGGSSGSKDCYHNVDTSTNDPSRRCVYVRQCYIGGGCSSQYMAYHYSNRGSC